MNVEDTYASSSGSSSGNFVTPPDSPVYYYNGGNQIMQQQAHTIVDQQHQQHQQPHHHHHHHQQQHQQPQLMSYSMSPSPSSMFRLGTSHLHGISSPALARALSTLSADKSRRPRSEKKPIPEEQKDDKYFERRRRNNEAAKKSRDARKAREDELAIRASFLEKDNSILKVQVDSMRDEARKLRNMWVAKCEGLANVRQMAQPGRAVMHNSILNQVPSSMGPPQGRLT